MKRVTLLPTVDRDTCTGCNNCQKVCPVYAIKVVDKKAQVDESACRGCANCADRCPFYAITMVKRKNPFEVKVEVRAENQEAVDKLCVKAHFNPQQVLCYCTGTRAEEVAAAIIGGATTPQDISSQTGIRTGCSIECIQPILRLLEAAGYHPEPDPEGWQWYGQTVTAWTLPEKVKEKYNSRGFYFDEDKALLDKIVVADCKGGN